MKGSCHGILSPPAIVLSDGTPDSARKAALLVTPPQQSVLAVSETDGCGASRRWTGSRSDERDHSR